MELVELIHAHWILNFDPQRDGWDRMRYYCSHCNDWNTYGQCDYCPDCGAKMDEHNYKGADKNETQ